MKTLIRMLCCGLALLAWQLPARAQERVLAGQGGFSNFAADIASPFDGHWWVGGTLADNGLGYQGSFYSFGTVQEVFSDPLGGNWTIDYRGHLSDERTQYFQNIGLERRVFFEPINSDINVGIWYDYDGDKPENFGFDYHQIGASAAILNDNWDVIANGYFPVGDVNHRQGHLGPFGCFDGNNIIIQPGLDSALVGFDVMFGIRPAAAQQWRGVIDLGGYYYRSQFVDSFGGYRARVGVEPLENVELNFQLDHDNQFATTGFLALQVHWGGGSAGRGGASPSGRGLVKQVRNSHIVRVHRDLIYATNPVTNELWNVIHVDNTNTVPGAGTVENPYSTLALAETGSAPNDIILVRVGDGTTFNQDMGIRLQDGQYLLGDGVRHLIPTREVGLFELCTNMGGVRPRITNLGGPAVILADSNTVAGFIIDGTAGGMTRGITTPAGGITGGAIIRDNDILEAEQQGIRIGGSTGDFAIFDNLIDDSQGQGIRINNSAGTFLIEDNTITDSALDGIEMVDNSGEALITDNTITGNGVGVSAGVRITHSTAAVGPMLARISGGNVIDGNGVGIVSNVNGPGALLATRIFDNTSISGNLTDGISVGSFRGATHLVMIEDNAAINLNGAASGVGIRMRVNSDVAGPLTTMEAMIIGNTLNDNAGDPGLDTATAGIYGRSENNSILDVLIEDNVLSGLNAVNVGFGDLVHFDYFGSVAANVNTLVIRDNSITDTNQGGVGFGQAIDINAFDMSTVDVLIDNNDLSRNFGAIFAFTSDTSLLRLVAEDNVATDGARPVTLATLDGSRMIATFRRNMLNTSIGVDGFEAFTVDTSTMVLDLINNEVNAHAGNGVGLFVLDSSSMFAFVRNNEIQMNTAANDFIAQVDFFATAAARLCLQLSNNAAGTPYELENLSLLGATFEFEDGGNNVPSPPTIIAISPVTPVAAGTCAAAALPFRAFP